MFDGRAVGGNTSAVTCIWDFELADGATLFAPQHAELLEAARHFFWSLYSDRRDGRFLKPSAAGNIFYGLRRLLKWMVEHNYAGFDELTDRASSRFCDWLIDFYAAPSLIPVEAFEGAESVDNADGGDDATPENKESVVDSGTNSNSESEDDADPADVGGVTAGVFANALVVWRLLWEQRSAMASVGVRGISEAPFSGRSVNKAAKELSTNFAKRIPALPDEVAIPLLNAAHDFMTTASDDLIRAVEELFQAREMSPQAASYSPSNNLAISAFFREFRFSTLTESKLVWHEPLGIRGTSPAEELRCLIDHLVDACVIIGQGETGMRIGEICSLRAGMNEETGLPSCVTVRPSKTGMLDLYYLKAKLTKLRPTPVDDEWLLAAAPRGSTILPEAVRAIVVLQKLLAPFRAMADSETAEYLLVTLGVPRGLPSTSAGVTEPNNNVIRNGQKSFARSFVDWDEVPLTEATRPYIESRGNCIRTHQWRKTYAQYVFQVNKRMLPAIARQFKHLSLAMTEGGYVGTSPTLVADVAEFNRNLTAEFFLANVRGRAAKQEGRLAKLMAVYRDELEKIVAGLSDSEALQTVDAWCRQREMRIFFHGYGKCVPAVAPVEAECHKRANTVHWANKAPNFATREPSICTGCYLFLADEDSVDHWTRRYTENLAVWKRANARGRGNEFRVARARADQAKSFLQVLGAEVPVVE